MNDVNLGNPNASAGKSRKLIPKADALKRFGNPSQMWAWRHKDLLPVPVKISGRDFYPEDELDACIEKLIASRVEAA
ncbi:helix-turn-helix transcriptional regulator [Aestuariivirga sp.]|uniref:helix-turn-helix transcriptional regulator n=1 Tax=Aestuariivirga sp. TaxID=2650926 RepID=UPI003592FDF9